MEIAARKQRQSRWSRMKKAIMNYGSKPKSSADLKSATNSGNSNQTGSNSSHGSKGSAVRKICSAVDLPSRSPSQQVVVSSHRNASMQHLTPLDYAESVTSWNCDYATMTSLHPDHAAASPAMRGGSLGGERSSSKDGRGRQKHGGGSASLRPSPDRRVDVTASYAAGETDREGRRQSNRWSLSPDTIKSSSFGEDRASARRTTAGDVNEAARRRHAAKNSRTRSVDDVINEKRKVSY